MDSRSQIWKPLNASKQETRLFVLAPSTYMGERPRVRLITKSLDQHPRYEALSHAWGNPTDPQLLLIGDSQWLITMSLRAALVAVRDEKKEKGHLGRCDLHVFRSIQNQMLQKLERFEPLFCEGIYGQSEVRSRP